MQFEIIVYDTSRGMPSRKKAQGRARKAAKAEVAAEAARKETDPVTQLNRLHMVEGYDNETCTHGYVKRMKFVVIL